MWEARECGKKIVMKQRSMTNLSGKGCSQISYSFFEDSLKQFISGPLDGFLQTGSLR